MFKALKFILVIKVNTIKILSKNSHDRLKKQTKT